MLQFANIRSIDSMHRSTSAGKCSDDVHKRPCSAFVEVNAPVFTREAWACV